MGSRNFICRFFPAGKHVVCLDDDVMDIRWKFRHGHGHGDSHDMMSLPPGGLGKIIQNARRKMAEHGAFLWGLNTSQNPKWMDAAKISVRNGLINGYIHGFISRPHCAELYRSLVDAAEDAEFSIRHFAKDGAVLRYRMYTGITSPFANSGGLQAKFESKGDNEGSRAANQSRSEARKVEERWGASELNRLFPDLVGPVRDRDKASTSLDVTFRTVASRSTVRTAAAEVQQPTMTKNIAAEKKKMPPNRKRRRAGEDAASCKKAAKRRARGRMRRMQRAAKKLKAPATSMRLRV